MDTSFYKSFMSEEIRDEGRAQGRAEGRAQGRAQGRAEGRAEGQATGQAEGIRLVLEARGIALTDETREKITTCTDPQLLHQWIQRAATATTAEEVFASK
ncbi:hypothetical protein [Streptomyces sp. NPDC048669]|uniref:hypothetical protein n=1 Tax=Streptomyces sp. NPDC048669 TaxID=3155267 RepID=UPI00341C1A39